MGIYVYTLFDREGNVIGADLSLETAARTIMTHGGNRWALRIEVIDGRKVYTLLGSDSDGWLCPIHSFHALDDKNAYEELCSWVVTNAHLYSGIKVRFAIVNKHVFWHYGRPEVGAELCEEVALAFAARVLDRVGVGYIDAANAHDRYLSDEDVPEGVRVLAEIWVEANRAANVGLTFNWDNPNGAACSLGFVRA